MSEPPGVTCPQCGMTDLIGPISKGFSCYACGWSYEYGLLTTGPYWPVWKAVMAQIHALEDTHLITNKEVKQR